MSTEETNLNNENFPSPNDDRNSGLWSSIVAGALFIWDFLKVLLIALVIIIPMRYFVFQPFIVSGSSMEPNFTNKQYLIIDEISFYFKQPERGQVVVTKHPKDSEQYLIKRIIGLPNEEIKIENGRVYVTNPKTKETIELDETYLPNQGLTYPHYEAVIGGRKTLVLGSDEYFVMGDNRLASSDSRDWGPVSEKSLVGKVFLRVLPLKQFELYSGVPAYSTAQ
jgi:signal peptidase I